MGVAVHGCCGRRVGGGFGLIDAKPLRNASFNYVCGICGVALPDR